MTFKKRYEIDAEVLVPVTIVVAANSAAEAEQRLATGAWHAVIAPNWDLSVFKTQTSAPRDVTVTGPDPRD